MNKSTQRGAFIDNTDLRIRTDRPFSKISKSKQERNLAYQLTDGAARTYINGFRRHNYNENKKSNPKIIKSNLY